MKEEGKKRNPQEKKERETFRQRDVGWRYSHWFGNGGSLETSAKSWERLRFCQCQTEGRRTSESWDVCEKLRKTQILSVSNWGRADFRVSRQSWRKPWRGTVSGLCVWNLCWLLSLFVMYKFVICLGTGCSGARFKPCVCMLYLVSCILCLRFSRRGGDAVHMGQERCLLRFLLLSHLCRHPCCHPRVYPGCKFSSAIDAVDFLI